MSGGPVLLCPLCAQFGCCSKVEFVKGGTQQGQQWEKPQALGLWGPVKEVENLVLVPIGCITCGERQVSSVPKDEKFRIRYLAEIEGGAQRTDDDGDVIWTYHCTDGNRRIRTDERLSAAQYNALGVITRPASTGYAEQWLPPHRYYEVHVKKIGPDGHFVKGGPGRNDRPAGATDDNDEIRRNLTTA